MNKSRSFLWSQRGQGLVEYILLLVVVVTIALTFMNLFAKPYLRWAQSYIGDYVECLLDQGELPALGGTSLIKDCQLNDPEFPESGKGTSSSASERGDSKNKRDGSSDSSGSGRTVLVSSDGRQFKQRRVGAMDGESSNSKQLTVGEKEQSKENGLYQARGTQFANGNRTTISPKVRGFAGLLEMEEAKIKKREQKVQKVAGSEGGEASRQAKKFSVEAKSRRVADVDLSGDGWSFGKLFRILLIIVLLIALILFIGGQVMQISKGMEK